jgi:lipopolysaccharide transport system ATP-binding protein
VSHTTVIRAEALGKKYVLGKQRKERYVALRDVVADTTREIVRSARDVLWRQPRSRDAQPDEFWALQDVHFEVQRGDVVGIIGRNGAGKSTLLKILSRITEPTRGRVLISARVASLLEVGTGFHPELTGRENIYLNGAILGMTRADIRRKFDEIVAFAEVERFLDTPVKRYSSGMYVRLAFAVAAHIEPEVLVVDEVLAVGDAAFQKKCLGKMSDVAKNGRTVLFVSHNMAAVEALCPRSIHLDTGRIVDDGPTSALIGRYLHSYHTQTADHTPAAKRIQDGLVLADVTHSPTMIRTGDPIAIEVAFDATGAGSIIECAVLLYSAKGMRVAVVDPRECGVVPLRYQAGRFSFVILVAELPLVEGDFSIGLYLTTDRFADDILDIDHFTVLPSQRPQNFSPYDPGVRGVLALKATSSLTRDGIASHLGQTSTLLAPLPSARAAQA